MHPLAEKLLAGAIAVGITGALVGGVLSMPRPALIASANAAEIPAPMLPAAPPASPPAPGHLETVVFAGGCFWGVQGVFQHVTGVTSAISGYAGGAAGTARYERVSDGDTGHAEAVKVTFDPAVVSYATLMRVYFSVAHDPTQLDFQGPDHGTQYRSEVFASTPAQADATRAYIAQLTQAKAFAGPIVTKVETGKAFFPAESYHQNYLTLNPGAAYIRYYDLPKLADLKRVYPTLYRPDPVLAATR